MLAASLASSPFLSESQAEETQFQGKAGGLSLAPAMVPQEVSCEELRKFKGLQYKG